MKEFIVVGIVALQMCFHMSLQSGELPTARADSLSVNTIKDFYKDIFKLERSEKGRVFFSLGAGKPLLPDAHPLAGLVNGNEFFFSYLIRNWSGTSRTIKEFASDTVRFPDNFYSALQQDSLFNSIFLPVAARFLIGQGNKFGEFVANQERQTVSLDRALNVAVRFFYPDGVDDEGGLTAHVCVGINGIIDLQSGRDPYLEALAYLAINKEMLKSSHGVVEAFLKAYNQMNQLDLSSNHEVRIIRAQGVMWGIMHKSPELKAALLEEQTRITEWLPVQIGP